MVKQQLDGEVGLQLPLEGSALQCAAQWGNAIVVDGVDVSPAPQEEACQAGVGGPACLVQGASPCLIPGIDVGAMGSQQPAKLQAALTSAWRLPTEDAEGCLLPCAARINMRPVPQVETGMVTEAVPGCHVQCRLPPVLAGQVNGGPVSQQELGTSAKRWGGWEVHRSDGFWGHGLEWEPRGMMGWEAKWGEDRHQAGAGLPWCPGLR